MLRRVPVWLFAFLVAAAGCNPAAQAPSNQTPVAHVTASPSLATTPSPVPSPVAPLRVAAASFHAAELGFGYQPARAAASGGVPPYSWSLSAGTLPGGLSMDVSGAVSGIPSTLGTFLFTAQVIDTAGGAATIDTTITVVRHVTVSPSCPTNFPCMAEAGCITACGGFGNQAGGIAPYSYKVVGGSLPTGMGLNGFSLTNAFPGIVAGTTRDWVFTVQVTDGVGATALTAAKFHVFPHISFTQAAWSCSGLATAGCQAVLSYTGGTPGLPSPPISSAAGAKPQGWTAVSNSGKVTVTVPKQACKPPSVTWTLTLSLHDGSQCAPGAGNYCTSGPATVAIVLTC